MIKIILVFMLSDMKIRLNQGLYLVKLQKIC